MDIKLAELKRAALSGGKEEWDAYDAELSRCGVAHHLKVLEDEENRIKLAWQRIRNRIVAVRSNCKHRMARFSRPHAAGVKCIDCGARDTPWISICRDITDCRHPPIELSEDEWKKMGV